MPIAADCPHCGHRISAPDTLEGRRVKCPGCGQAVRVPAARPAEGLAERSAVDATQPDRLAAIERENARLRSDVARLSKDLGRLVRAGVVAVALLAVACVAPWLARLAPSRDEGPTPPADLQARRLIARSFDLVDAEGEPRAVLEMNQKGQPELRFLSGGVDRAILGLWGGGNAQLVFRAAKDLQPRLVLNASEMLADLTIWDTEGDSRIHLSTMEDSASMSILGPDLHPGVQFGVSPGGVAEISAFDVGGKYTPLLDRGGRPLFPVSEK